MGFLDKIRTCAQNPSACASNIKARATNTVRSTPSNVGQSVGRAYQKGSEKVGEAWRCRPGSTCAKQRAEDREIAKTAEMRKRNAARDEYVEAKQKEAKQRDELRKANDSLYKNSTRGRLEAGARNVYNEAMNASHKGAKSVAKDLKAVGRSRESVAARPRGRPVGSGRGNYSRNGPRYANLPGYDNGNDRGFVQAPRSVQAQPLRQRGFDPLGDIEFDTKSRVRSLDDKFSRLM